MGWSHALTEQHRREREESATPERLGCPPAEERHAYHWNSASGRWWISYFYRHPGGEWFGCFIAGSLADAQARRNAWLVERVAAAQRERARAEAQDAAALVDADLYRDDRGNYS